MTYTFKLARRLAVSRDCAMLATLAVVAACTGDTTTAPDSAESIPSQVAVLSVSPRMVTAETNQPIRFRGHERSLRGDAYTSATVWSSTGGSISADGTFLSSTTGTFRVVGRGRGWKQSDTAVVVVVPPTTDVTRLVISPDATTLEAGATHSFSATAYLADGSTAKTGVNWTSTGGEIDAAGSYTAGTTAGSYRVIAATTSGTVADTASVSVTVPAAPAPTEPAPVPTLTAVYVTPVSVSLNAGATQAFKVYGRNSDGDSVPVTVAFSATGGTVSSTGLFTAGTSGGSFRVVARESVSGKADTSAVAITVAAPAPAPTPTGTGIPYGPFGLWSSNTTVSWGPTPFTMSQNYTDPSGIVTQIAAARNQKQRLVLAMTGGSHSNYLTNGAFDYTKWKSRMNLFNTSTIRNAVAAGVADGTIIGNSVMDEPEFRDWGGVMTKPLLDQMASYVKAIFPTLPVGVNHGPNGYYQWRPTERYRVLDYVLNQYSWWVTTGNVAAYRDKVLAQAALDGVQVAFSLNLLNGGVQDKDGTYSCDGAGQGGKGLTNQNCRMTAQQVRDWGLTLGRTGCAMFMWRYDDTFMSRSDNQQAFRDVAGGLASSAAKSCRRP
jgi:hypothetical protein